MDLATHQRALLGLMRSSYQVSEGDDDYLQQVAVSRDLEEARGNVYLWRVYVLERTCVLTMALLRQKDLLAPVLQDFIRGHNVSPFREYQPLAFLAALADHPDALLVSVSQFELALIKVREGDPASYCVHWHTDPLPVLGCLAQDAPLGGMARGAYRTRVSGALAQLFEIESA